MSDINEIWEMPVPWLSGQGIHSDVALAGRMRLARNLENYPFPHHASEDKLEEIVTRIQDVITSQTVLPEATFIPLQRLSLSERQMLLERRLISPEFAQRSSHGAVVLDRQCRISLMVNEEDHIRLQALDAGMNLDLLWEQVHRVDMDLGKVLDYAFSEEFGSLTSCPTNTGTGLRISILMYLPALALDEGNLGAIFHQANPAGLTVRGFYGEGSDVVGNIYQISNKLTLGWTEFRLLEDLLKIASQIVDKEQDARRKLMENRHIDVEDKIFRSLGLLERARKLSSREFIEQYANLMLGILIGLITEIEPQALHELILWVQPAHLQWQYGKDLSPVERDVYRAEMVRTKLGL